MMVEYIVWTGVWAGRSRPVVGRVLRTTLKFVFELSHIYLLMMAADIK